MLYCSISSYLPKNWKNINLKKMSPLNSAIWGGRLLLNIPDSTNSGSSLTVPRHLFSLSQSTPKGFSFHFLQPSQHAQITFTDRDMNMEKAIHEYQHVLDEGWFVFARPKSLLWILFDVVFWAMVGLWLVRCLNFNWHIIKGGLWQSENVFGLDFFLFFRYKVKRHAGQKCNGLVDDFCHNSFYIFVYFPPPSHTTWQWPLPSSFHYVLRIDNSIKLDVFIEWLLCVKHYTRFFKTSAMSRYIKMGKMMITKWMNEIWTVLHPFSHRCWSWNDAHCSPHVKLEKSQRKSGA